MSKPALWATSTAPRANSRNAGSTVSIFGALHTMAEVMPVSCDDLGRNASAGVDQRGQLAEHRAAAHLDRADLGDGVAVVHRRRSRGPGRLEIHHDERGVAQGHGMPVSKASLLDVGEAQLAPCAEGRQSTDSAESVTRAGAHPLAVRV